MLCLPVPLSHAHPFAVPTMPDIPGGGRRIEVQLLFSTTLALSCSMLVLIVFEILDVMSFEARWLNWKFDLVLLQV